MAVVELSHPFKEIKGSMGGSTYTRDADGRIIARAKATSVSNPRTTAQMAQRNPFGVLAKWGSKAKITIARGFRILDGELKRKSARNRFLSQNIKAAVVDGEVDFLDVKFGRGELVAPVSVDASLFVDAAGITVVGTNTVDLGVNASFDDKMFLGVLGEDGSFNLLLFKSRNSPSIDGVVVDSLLVKCKYILIAGYITNAEYLRYTGSTEDKFTQALTGYLSTDLQSDFVVLAEFDYV